MKQCMCDTRNISARTLWYKYTGQQAWTFSLGTNKMGVGSLQAQSRHELLDWLFQWVLTGIMSDCVRAKVHNHQVGCLVTATMVWQCNMKLLKQYALKTSSLCCNFQWQWSQDMMVVKGQSIDAVHFVHCTASNNTMT